MSLTGSIVIYICIWWIIFFASLPIGISHKNKKFEDTIAGADPGSPKNPKIGKKFLHNIDYYNNFHNHIFYGRKTVS